MGDVDIIKEYSNLYEGDQNFSKEYLYKRISLYRKIVSIIEDLGINSMLDTLRFLKSVKNILKLEAQFIIIKEVSNNFYIRRKRRKAGIYFQLYSPCDYLKIFPEYSVLRIYSSKFLFHVEKTNFLGLKLMNLLPTYTIVLKRNN
jgi:hypothetical protein